MHLQIDHVYKWFGHTRPSQLVLDDINFSVHAGEFVAVVGRSGSGKSTLLRLIAGLEQPSRGSVLLDGQPVRGPGPDRGMVFQNYSLYPWLSAAANVAFGMRLQRRSRADIRDRTAYFLDVVGLAHAGELMPRQLSGGMQQRVAIARALAAEPKVLLLDEPFGALDIQIRETMQQFLHQLWQRTGLTAVLITHDLEEALLLAGTVHVMAPAPGRINRSVAVQLDRSDLGALRLSPHFLCLREDLANGLRSLEPDETLLPRQL